MCTLEPRQPLGLPEYPSGWYCIGFSKEIQGNSMLTRQLMGQEVVVYRGRDDVLVVAGAHCPHLGAHFAHGGRVVDGQLECPFHAFRFDELGQCTQTGYGTKPPGKAKLRIWPSREQAGLLLVWYHPEGRAPMWEVPELDSSAWSPWSQTSWRVKTHPQEITENSVDFGHFSAVHGYDETEVVASARLEGPHLYARYAMTRMADVFFGRGQTIRTEFDVAVHGLGVSVVHAKVIDYDLNLRILVLPTPVGNGQVELRAALAVNEDLRPANVSRALAVVPRFLAKKLIRAMAFRGYAHDIQQDFPMWENKIYIERPALAKGDGPIGLYRRWSRQFYPSAEGKLVQLPRKPQFAPAA